MRVGFLIANCNKNIFTKKLVKYFGHKIAKKNCQNSFWKLHHGDSSVVAHPSRDIFQDSKNEGGNVVRVDIEKARIF